MSSIASVSALALMCAVTLANTTPSNAVTTTPTTVTNASVDSDAATTPYPIGIVDSAEPSGYAPPGAAGMPGYNLTYSNDFTGTTLPSGWSAYSGAAAGDPGSYWAPGQVSVSGGMVQLTTSQDAAMNDDWVSGGIGQSGEALTYGAFFVRSRMTGIGPTQVELLWPASGGWPPEIDFDETYGGDTLTQATLHYTSANLEIHNNLTIDMTQWHTFGIVWSPASIIFTVDGNAWASITTPADIPDQPMGLDIQQQTWCSSGMACPTAPASTDVDWVSEYSTTVSSPPVTTTTSPPTTTTTMGKSPTGPSGPPSTPTNSPVTPIGSTVAAPTTTTTAPAGRHLSAESMTLDAFANDSASLSGTLRKEVARLAKVIKRDDDSEVILTGYCSDVINRSAALAIARARAVSVDAYLQERFAALGESGVKIVVRGAITGGASVTANVRSRSVVALLR